MLHSDITHLANSGQRYAEIDMQSRFWNAYKYCPKIIVKKNIKPLDQKIIYLVVDCYVYILL